ncbi:Hypothetical predicted protein [Marmota monax]|uniref:Uncharacterized protein n=1 Tax=Marmota monax TaxID=9995 RepID=A0A5E4CEF2_MARMO|nr:hypothetical protein GHT09_018720 [Marmota monax]VTJ79341.1 Hypothetical predicted protein [Marmota monax]
MVMAYGNRHSFPIVKLECSNTWLRLLGPFPAPFPKRNKFDEEKWRKRNQRGPSCTHRPSTARARIRKWRHHLCYGKTEA